MATTLAARRTTEVLRHLARDPHGLPTLTELAEALGVGHAAMHGVLEALVEAGLIERTREGKRYRLGHEAVVLGSAARSATPMLARASAAALHVSERHACTAAVVARQDDELVVLDVHGPEVPEEALSRPGAVLPPCSPAAGAFLAWSPPQDVLAWIAECGHDPAGRNAEALRREVDAVRSLRRWITSRAESDVILAPCVAVGPPELALAALVSGPNRGRVPDVAAALVTEAASVWPTPESLEA